MDIQNIKKQFIDHLRAAADTLEKNDGLPFNHVNEKSDEIYPNRKHITVDAIVNSTNIEMKWTTWE